MIYFKDEKIVIRDLCEKDVVNLFRCKIDKEINKYDPLPIPKNSKELVEECINYCNDFDEKSINKNNDERFYRYFIIEDMKGNFIGFVNFFNIDKVKKDGELGVIIGDKRYWRLGIAYKAIKIVKTYIFEKLNMNTIYVEIESNNVPSINLFKKLGFIKCDEFIEDKSKFIVMETYSHKLVCV